MIVLEDKKTRRREDKNGGHTYSKSLQGHNNRVLNITLSTLLLNIVEML